MIMIAAYKIDVRKTTADIFYRTVVRMIVDYIYLAVDILYSFLYSHKALLQVEAHLIAHYDN